MGEAKRRRAAREAMLKNGSDPVLVDQLFPEFKGSKLEDQKIATEVSDLGPEEDHRFTDTYGEVELRMSTRTMRSPKVAANIRGPFTVIQANGQDLFVHRSFRMACAFTDLFHSVPLMAEMVNASLHLSSVASRASGLPGPDGKPPQPVEVGELEAATDRRNAALKAMDEYVRDVSPVLADIAKETHDLEEARKRGGGPIGQPRRPSGLVDAMGRPL